MKRMKAYVPPIDKRARSSTFEGKVIIVGAGTAGLFAAYTLKYLGVDFEILEANNDFGGRVQEMVDFADVPLDLGAEWIHANPIILKDLLLYKNDQRNMNIATISYRPKTYGTFNPKTNKVKSCNWFRFIYREYKFLNTTWYSYLQKYVYPYVSDKLHMNTVVDTIDYSRESEVIVHTTDGRSFSCDAVIVATPVTIIQQGDIKFLPKLSMVRYKLFKSVYMTAGFKAWIEFDDRFYPDLQIPGNLMSFLTRDKIYFDGVFRKESNRNILTLFQVGEGETYIRVLMDDDTLFSTIMAELDKIFNGKASKHYVQHRIQNWFAQKYIKGAYSYNDYDWTAVGAPLDKRVYFAGEYLGGDEQATVHGAGISGREVAQRLLIDHANK